jgi:ankyrin repeat protein
MTDAAEQLRQAVTSGDSGSVRQLLAAYPQLAQRRPDAESLVLQAVYHGHREVAGLFLEAGYPLDVFEAAALGRLERVRELVAANPELPRGWSADGFTPLMLAAFFGQAPVVRFLLEWGADAAAVSRNTMRVMALHSAVAGRHVEAAEALLAHGAPVNARQDGGYTPLHQAAQYGQAPMIRLLLTYGADPSLTMNAGRTPADLARAQGHQEAVPLLGPRR